MSVQLVSKISNVCDHNPPTSQTDRGQTDGRHRRHAIAIPRFALVHRAIKIINRVFETRNESYGNFWTHWHS